MKLARIVQTWNAVSRRSGRLEKVAALAAVLRDLEPNEIPIGVAYLSGELPQGRIGVGPAMLRDALSGEAAGASTLTLLKVNERLSRMAAVKGKGSSATRRGLLRELLDRATAAEQAFLGHLLLGELRQGAQEGLMLEAVAEAATVPRAAVRRAVMLAGDAGAVARATLEGGSEALADFRLRLFTPVLPMLAQTSEDVGDALASLGEAAFEHKLDGARIQLHKSGGDVRLYTRRQNDVTEALPEILDAARRLPVREAVLDGEVLALAADGSPRPFQVTMRRFGRKIEIGRMRDEIPLSAFFFDCLYLDGKSLIDRPAAVRFAALSDAVPEGLVVPRLITEVPEEANAFLRMALRMGHEGLMAKALDASYAAGARGRSWLKIKPAYTLDLVVLAAEWGHGRRRGWLSNLHLGARDPASGGFVMLGKTFKGMTDRMLAWQTERLLELEAGRQGHVVHVRPELVVEVAFNDIQASPQYPAGLALRFARVRRYREDKQPLEADTVDAVRAIYVERRGD